MFGAAPIERSSQKSRWPSTTPSASVSAARSEKELSQLLMSGSSTEHLALTRSGSAGQLRASSPITVSSVSVASMSHSVARLSENTQKGLTIVYRLLSLSAHLNGHFPGGSGLAGTRMSPFWILLELRVMEVVLTTGAMRRAKLQSGRHHQQTNIQFLRSTP